MSATWVAIPRTTYERLLGLVKGAGHKYLKKVHAGVDPRTGKTRWRYYYKLTEGRALGDTADLAVGAKFQVRDGELKGHVEVLARHDDGTVTVRHDESGKEERLAADALRARLVHEHRSALEDHARRLRADYVRARLHGGGSLRERRHAELRAFVAKYPELRSWAEELPEPRPPAWRPAGYDENRRILDAFEGLRVATPRFDGHAAQGPRPIPAAYKRAAQTLLDALAARFGSLDDATTKGQKYLENASKGADVKGLVSQLRRLIAGSEAQWWDYAAGGVHQTEQAVVFHQAKLDLAIDAKEPLTAPAALFADIVRTEARRSYVVDNKGTRTGLETLLDMAGQVRTKRGLDAFVMLLRAGTGPGASNTRAAAETLGYTLSTAREAFQRAHEEMARLGRESLVSTITRPTPELDAAIAADIKTVREADLEDIGDMLESTEQSTMRHGLGRFEQVADVREHRFSQLTPEHSEVKRLFRERFGVRIALEDAVFDSFLTAPEAEFEDAERGYTRRVSADIEGRNAKVMAQLSAEDRAKFKRWMSLDQAGWGLYALERGGAARADVVAANEVRLASQLSREVRADALRGVYNALVDMEKTVGGKLDLSGLPVVVSDRFVGGGATAHYLSSQVAADLDRDELARVRIRRPRHGEYDSHAVKLRPHIALGMGTNKALGHEIVHYLENRTSSRATHHEAVITAAVADWVDRHAMLSGEAARDWAAAKAKPDMRKEDLAAIAWSTMLEDTENGAATKDLASFRYSYALGTHKYLSNLVGELVKRGSQPHWQTPRAKALRQQVLDAIKTVPTGRELVELHEAVAEAGGYDRFVERDATSRSFDPVAMLAELRGDKESAERSYYALGTEVTARSVEQYLYEEGVKDGRVNTTLTHAHYTGKPDWGGPSAYHDPEVFNAKIAPKVKALLGALHENMTKSHGGPWRRALAALLGRAA